MKKTSLKALLGAGVSAVAFGAVAPAYAADLDPEPAKEYVEVCPNSGFRGAILLPGTGVCFKVGGYAKADFIYRFDDFAAGFGGINETALSSPSAFGGVGGDRFRGHAAQTRINFDARTTTDLGSARAFIEGDFFSFEDSAGVNENVSNSERFRLRHAIVELGIDALGGSLLAGQFWTNFGDLGSFANTLDFQGPNGQVFIRQAQIRWTQPLNDTFTLSVSAENPELSTGLSSAPTTAASAITGAGAILGAEDADSDGFDTLPDFTLALKARTAYGNFHLGGLFRYFDIDEGAQIATNASRAAAGGVALPIVTDTAFGWGVQFAGTINVGDKDKFRFQVNYGQGIGRYLQLGGSNVQFDAVNNNLDTDGSLGVIASYQHFWSDKLQSNLIGSYARIEDTNLIEVANETEFEEIYAAINLIYSPRSNINVGIEGNYQRAETTSAGVSSDVDGFSVQTSFQFVF